MPMYLVSVSRLVLGSLNTCGPLQPDRQSWKFSVHKNGLISAYVLGSEAWEEYSSGLLGLIKDFVLSVWEERLYGKHANVHQSHSQGI